MEIVSTFKKVDIPLPLVFCQLKESINIQLWRGLKTIWQHFLRQKEWFSRQPGRTSIIREPSYGTNERKYLHGSPVKPFFYIIKAYLVQCAWSCRQRYCTFINFDDFHLSTMIKQYFFEIFHIWFSSNKIRKTQNDHMNIVCQNLIGL